MKKLFLLSLFAIFSMSFGFAQTNQPEKEDVDGAGITFEKLVHDDGTIKKGGDGTCSFQFTNNGNEPLILSGVRASCGCTTPSWTKAPIMPGQTGEIKVKYNTHNVGGFTKSVTVTSNAVNSPRIVLKIKGQVKNM